MSELRQFKLPDVGEGLTEADIVSWHVQPGDTVKVNQIIVEIETAKAVVELPSPHAGMVASLLVTEGETVDVGTPIIGFEVAAGAGGAGSRGQRTKKASQNEAADVSVALAEPGPLQTPTAADLVPQPPPGAADGGPQDGGGKPERQAVLVGYGVKLGATTRRARKPGAARRPATVAASGPAASTAPGAPASAPAAPPAATAGSAGPGSAGPGGTGPGSAVLAKPPVRKLARDLGVDLAALSGTGPNGSITRDDVQAAVRPRSRATARRAGWRRCPRWPARSGSRSAACASTPPPR